jgi:hypothetical protein
MHSVLSAWRRFPAFTGAKHATSSCWHDGGAAQIGRYRGAQAGCQLAALSKDFASAITVKPPTGVFGGGTRLTVSPRVNVKCLSLLIYRLLTNEPAGQHRKAR